MEKKNNSENSDSVMKSASTGKMMLFAFPRIGSSLLLGIIGFTLLLLYSKGYGLEKSTVSFVISGGYLAIAISQFFFGWISDITYSEKLGGRKPYVFILAPLLAISFIFLLMPGLVLKNPDRKTLLIWLIIWNTLFEICYAVTTPYQAWMAEQFSVEDRPKCSQIQNTFNFIGQTAQVLFSMIVLTNFAKGLEENPNYIPPQFFWICIIFAVFFIGSFYFSTILMPKEAKPAEKPNLIENFKTVLKDKNYLLVVLMQGLASIAWIMVGTVMLSFLEDVLQLNSTEYMIAAGSLIIVTIIFFEVWKRIIKRNGKKKSILYVFLGGVIFFPISLIGFTDWNALIVGLIFMFGISVVMAGWYLFPYIMYADLAENDQRKSNKMKAGIYAGFPSIALNLLQAVGVAILGLILKLPDVTIRSEEVSMGMMLWGPICSIILIGVIFYTKKFVKLDFDWEKKEEDIEAEPTL